MDALYECLTDTGIPSNPLPGICFDNSYARLPGDFYRACEPEPVTDPKLIVFNRRLGQALGLDCPASQPDSGHLWLPFSGNRLPTDASPLAMVYAGHQFGHFVPRLGDGRAILLGEVIDPCHQRWDLQLKGSGKTAFSRSGDGRAPLGPVLREYLLSEAMHALGVPTTRALAAVTTGDSVARENVEPGAILTRVSQAFIRVGTFEYFARRKDKENIIRLADYTISRLAPQLMAEATPYDALLRWTINRQAQLLAHWVSLGFIHGAMNTDNMSMAGETLDYGPCAFLDSYDPDAVFSSIDTTGRYAFNNQVSAAQWNLSRLAEALLSITDGSESEAVVKTTKAVNEFRPLYDGYYLKLMRARLGMADEKPGDQALVDDLLKLLARQNIDYTNFFLNLRDDLDGGGITAGLFGSAAADYLNWYRAWHHRISLNERSLAHCAELMDSSNPRVIPRNHMVESVIRHALKGDFSTFNELLEVMTRPFETPSNPQFQAPPLSSEKVQQTFCGT